MEEENKKGEQRKVDLDDRDVVKPPMPPDKDDPRRSHPKPHKTA